MLRWPLRTQIVYCCGWSIVASDVTPLTTRQSATFVYLNHQSLLNGNLCCFFFFSFLLFSGFFLGGGTLGLIRTGLIFDAPGLIPATMRVRVSDFAWADLDVIFTNGRKARSMLMWSGAHASTYIFKDEKKEEKKRRSQRGKKCF